MRRLGLVQWRGASRRRIGQCLEEVNSGRTIVRPGWDGREEAPAHALAQVLVIAVAVVIVFFVIPR